MHAVVTGASSGIGAAVAGRLLEDGARVVGLARNGDAMREAFAAYGDRFVPVVADLSDPEARARAIEEVLASVDRVDLLVNNAGACVYAGTLGVDWETWRSLGELNLWAAIELTRALVPVMGTGSLVVNVSSVTARHLPAPRFAPYAMTKVALDQFTESLRLELGPRGIKVTLLAPGLVDTAIYDKVDGFASAEERIRRAVPEWLAPADVADTVSWLVRRPAHVVVGEMVLLPLGQGR